MYLEIISFKPKVFGTPLSSVKKIIPNVDCKDVCLYKLFKITLAFASLFKEIVIVIPSFKSL